MAGLFECYAEFRGDLLGFIGILFYLSEGG